MNTSRLPWEIVETLPWSDPEELARYEAAADDTDPATAVPALVGASLVRYWAAALHAADEAATGVERRTHDVERAALLARAAEDPDLLATALLGRLYACWGPPDPALRSTTLQELQRLKPFVSDQELRVRITEWQVLERFDVGDLDGVRSGINAFLAEADGLGSKLFARREILWRANLEMLEGRIELGVQLNEEAIASTADLAGSPFSFQNVAITTAIAMYFRQGLGDVIGAIRSIRASSPRVETNWEVGLTFALSEIGELDEARERFDALAGDAFAAIPRDLNWLVAMQLLGLVAVNLDDTDRAAVLRDALKPFSGLDATHGSGYASYGPIDRTLGLLAERLGHHADALRLFTNVLTTRAPGPWTTLARADRARLRRATQPVAALDDAEQASDELRAFGLDVRAERVRELITAIRLDGQGGPVARHHSGRWSLRHPSGHIDVDDSVGIRYLVELLRRPGEPFDVLDLDTQVDPSMPRTTTAESTLDGPARRAYRERLTALSERGDLTGDELEEVDFLRRELGAANRVSASAREIEKARVRVTKAIVRTMSFISAGSPGLGDHLEGAVVTGRRCSYQPIDGVEWRVER